MAPLSVFRVSQNWHDVLSCDVATDVEGADRARTDGQRQAFAEYKANLDKASAQWQSIRSTDLPALNARLHTADMKAITIPAASQLRAEAPADSDDLP